MKDTVPFDNEQAKNYISAHTPKAALYEQLAEEASELAMASLKYARILRGDNPTPISAESALKAVTEEYSDIHCAAYLLGLAPDTDCVAYKLERWYKRVREKERKWAEDIRAIILEESQQLMRT